MTVTSDPRDILGDFPALDRALYAAASVPIEVIGNGLINATWRVGTFGEFILQCLHPVFGPEVNDDIGALTPVLRKAKVPVPRIFPNWDGAWSVRVGDEVWRLLSALPGKTIHSVGHRDQAIHGAQTLALFHKALLDSDHVFQSVRAGAHDTDAHMAQAQAAVDSGSAHRLHADVAPMVAELVERWEGCPRAAADLPLRVCHGDLKISNFLFDSADRAVGLIDLDTMAWSTLEIEIGDLLRSWCNLAGEDAERPRWSDEVFDASVGGYLSIASGFITEAETRSFVCGLERIALELAARFAGDAITESYFGWSRRIAPGRGEHNLIRARNQLQVAKIVGSQRDRLQARVAELAQLVGASGSVMKPLVLAGLLCAWVLVAGCPGPDPGQPTAQDAETELGTPDAAADAETDVGAQACPPPALKAGEVRARVLTCIEELPDNGPFVAAQLGDLVLENAVARFVVRGQPQGHTLIGVTAGQLVDAVVVGRADLEDGLQEYLSTVDFHLVEPSAIEVTADGAGGRAVVRVSGELVSFPLLAQVLPLAKPAAGVVQEFRLGPDTGALEITTLLDKGDGGSSVNVADVGFWRKQALPLMPGEGVGDDLPQVGQTALLGYGPLLHGGATAGYAAGTSGNRELLGASGIVGLIASPTLIDGVTIESTRWLAVAPTVPEAMAMVAQVSGAAAWMQVSGTVAGAPKWVGVWALDEQDKPLVRCPVAADGSFGCPVPPTTVRMASRFDHDSVGVQYEWNVSSASTDVGDGTGILVPAPQGGTVVITVTDADSGEPLGFRATLSADVDGDGVDHIHFAPSGGATQVLPPATWTLVLNHGPHFTQHTVQFDLAAGTTQSIDASLRRVVDTGDWVSADYHVHAERSTDSDQDTSRRMAAARVEGLDLYVATEHDRVAALDAWRGASDGTADEFIVVEGVEVSTLEYGHFNVWPLPFDPQLAGGGAPDWFDLGPLPLLERLRAAVGPAGVVQCNHPRFNSASYFDAIDFDGASSALELVSCDVMELINGIGHDETGLVFDDWRRILARGHHITATGVSDCHGASDVVGNPRTYVRLAAGQRTTGFEAADVDAALKAGKAIASGGPLLTVEVTDGDGKLAAIGDTLTSPNGPLTATVRLQAPDWMIPALNSAEVWISGANAALATEDLTALTAMDERVDHSWTVQLPADPGFVVLIHRPGAGAKPGIHRPAYVVTNPVYVQP